MPRQSMRAALRFSILRFHPDFVKPRPTFQGPGRPFRASSSPCPPEGARPAGSVSRCCSGFSPVRRRKRAAAQWSRPRAPRAARPSRRHMPSFTSSVMRARSSSGGISGSTLSMPPFTIATLSAIRRKRGGRQLHLFAAHGAARPRRAATPRRPPPAPAARP